MLRRLLTGLRCGVLVVFAATAQGADKKGEPTYTDPKEAGEAFEIQGEYSGSWEEDGEKRTVGVQVIALGKDEFEAVAYHGGLPGDGGEAGGEPVRAKGRLEDGVVRFSAEEGRGRIENGKFVVGTPDGEEIATLEKVHRESPTLGAKPPEGAVVLFSGESADKFEGGKVNEEGYLQVGTRSKEQFGSHTLHLEFRTPFMPESRGQGRGNSGVYPQGRYEIQVLDSFGLEGKDNECGGIYSVSAPKVNMCFPPLSWQTYDIDLTTAKFDESGKKTEPARITVRHNGVVIHDNLELKGTPGGTQGEGPGPGPLFLQDHGNPVVYRNIWAVPK